jgi:DNA-binding transcriptional ArsR family regulator
MSKTLAEKVYARVMVALADPIREEILRLLLGKSDGLPFTEIGITLEIKSGAVLYRHLNALQRACLVERTSVLGDLGLCADPCYDITAIGRAIIPSVPDAVRTAISEALASKSIPEYYPGENGPLGSFSL